MNTPSAIFKKELWTKPLFSWYLYDFANSFVYINTTLYFSQWVVVDNKVPDFWLAVPFMIGTAVLVFLSPYIGNYGDRRGAHYRIFFWTTLAAILSMILIFISGRIGLDPRRAVIIALILYAFYQFFYQLALVPYGVFMKYLAPRDGYGKVSGMGLGASQVGNIAGLLLTLPIIYGSVTVFGTDRLAPLLPAVAIFFIFSLPSFFILRSRSFGYHTSALGAPAPSLLKSLWHNLREARRYPGVLPLLVSFYFFSDASISLIFFSAIYLQKVFGADDPFKVKAAVLVIIGFLIGAVIGGALSDRWGHKRILLSALVGNVMVILVIALIRDVSFNLILFPFFGVFNGAALAVSRSYFASLIPEQESGKFFGLYAFAERFASVFGPLFWSLTVWIFAAYAPWNYRAAVLAMGFLVIIGIVPLLMRQKHAPSVIVNNP